MMQLRTLLKKGVIDAYDEKVLRELMNGDRSFGQLRKATRITKPTLSKHLRGLESRLGMIISHTSPMHRGIPIYSLNEPYPAFIATLRKLESDARRFEDYDSLFANVLAPSLHAIMRCLVLGVEDGGRAMRASAFNWAVFLQLAAQRSMLLNAQNNRALELKAIILAMAKDSAEIAELWQTTKASRHIVTAPQA